MAENRDRSHRTPPATRPAPTIRHGRQRPSRSWKGLLGLIGISAVVALVVGTSLGGVALWHLNDNIQANAVEIGNAGDAPLPSIGEFEGGFNIMIVGIDNDPDQSSKEYGKRGGTLNDVNMLLHVSADHTRAVAVSIPRDMVVPVPACDRLDGKGKNSAMSGRPINETYSVGGLKCVVDTVSSLTGLEIPFAGVITFDGVISMSDVIGGVEVCTTGPIVDSYTGLNLPEAGTYTLQGKQAELFVRTRHGVGDGSDLGRISSQQVFLSSLVRKLMAEGTLRDIGKLYSIAEVATSNMKLSTSLASLDTMVSIASALKDLDLAQVTFVQYPGTTGQPGIYSGKVAPIKSQADKLFAKIRADEPFALDANSVGGSGWSGSVLDPNAPVAETPENPTTTDPATPAVPAPETIAGVKGQTAAQQTCAQPYGGG